MIDVTTQQLAVVLRIKAAVEQASELVHDEACLDSLEGPEAQNLAELQNSLSSAGACLRALKRQLRDKP